MRHDAEHSARQQRATEAASKDQKVTKTSKTKATVAQGKKTRAADDKPSFGQAAFVDLQAQSATLEKGLKAVSALQATYIQMQIARAQNAVTAKPEMLEVEAEDAVTPVTPASMAAAAYAQMATITAPPSAKVWAVLGVGMEVLGPIALVVGAWSRWTAVVLIGFTVVMTWATYKSAMFSLPIRNPQHPQFFKNVAVVAGLLFYFVSGPGSFSWRRGAQV
jgi:putative oxidoreductase